jgi:hypothetical protein
MKPEHQQPPLGRNPNGVERWQTVNQVKTPHSVSQANSKRTSSSRQTGVWPSKGEQDALQTGVWNPARQGEAPAGNRWVLLGIVVVCSLSSFAIFQSLLRPTVSNRVISARVNPASSTAPRDLPAAVAVQPSEADQVAASAVTFGEQSASGVTQSVQTPASGTNSSSTASSSTASSTIVETTPINTLPANQIRLEQVDSIGQSGGQPVLRFKDGSSLTVDAFTLRQLPSNVQLRITYSRGRDGP